MQMAYVLLQKQLEGTDKLIINWSKSARRRQMSIWNNALRNIFADVWAVVRLPSYLDSCQTTIPTAQDALNPISTFNNSTANLARWQIRLLKFEFEVVDGAGIRILAADELQWRKMSVSEETPIKEDILVIFVVASLPKRTDKTFFTLKSMTHRATE